MLSSMNLSDYIERCRKQYPNIRPFEEEDDVHWWNQGLDAMDEGDLDLAENIFRKLVLAQPNHSDGFNGLGLVYEKRAQPAQAEIFLKEAISKAEQMLKDGSMDPEGVNIIRADLQRVLKQ